MSPGVAIFVFIIVIDARSRWPEEHSTSRLSGRPTSNTHYFLKKRARTAAPDRARRAHRPSRGPEQRLILHANQAAAKTLKEMPNFYKYDKNTIQTDASQLSTSRLSALVPKQPRVEGWGPKKVPKEREFLWTAAFPVFRFFVWWDLIGRALPNCSSFTGQPLGGYKTLQ